MKATHPHISGLTIEINDDRAADYEAAGWLIKKPRKATVKDANNSPATDETN